MSKQRSRRLVVTCPTCETHAAVDEPNDAIEMFRRHEGVTGHQLEWERVDLDLTVPADGVGAVLDELGDRYEGGVPLGVLTAAMSERGVSIAETLEEVYSLRMSGRLYEPRDDHLTAL